nr:T-cell receptor alpha chain V region 2B4 precursor [Salmo salar]
MSLILLFLLSAFVADSMEQETITPVKPEVNALQGTDITLSCNYKGNVNNLQWYRHYPGSSPECLLLILPTNKYVQNTSITTPRHTGRLNEEKTRVDLMISSVELEDSALYHCALPLAGSNNKLIFGSGVNAIVQSREKHEPSYYTLNSSNTTACLATDFSAHKANSNSEVFNNTEATRVKGDSYYSQVALEKNCTKEDGSEKCEANWYFDTDAKINFLSLTILGLRILFLKTIVFNVLMTLRLWMS